MRVLLITLLFVTAAVFYPYPQYLYKAEESAQIFDSAEPPLLVFWGKRKHVDNYNVGSIYQLKSAENQLLVKLFSITYASSRPDDVKLAFYYLGDKDPKHVMLKQKYKLIQQNFN